MTKAFFEPDASASFIGSSFAFATPRAPWPALPRDAYAARGHSGQWVVVVPSAGLVVLRLGLGQQDVDEDGTQELVADLLSALR